MRWFDEVCRQRHDAGVREHRGGDPNAPFAGDPLAEQLDELADCANYLRESARLEGFPAEPGEWPSGWLNQWNTYCAAAEWVRRRMVERAARADGGIAWECGDIRDQTGRV